MGPSSEALGPPSLGQLALCSSGIGFLLRLHVEVRWPQLSLPLSFQVQVQQEERRKDTHLSPRAQPQPQRPSLGLMPSLGGEGGSSAPKRRTESNEGAAGGANLLLGAEEEVDTGPPK